MLLAASLQSYIIIITVNNYQVIANCSDAESLEYYLNNTSKYFVSNNRLEIQPGMHSLNVDLIIENITNFALICEGSCNIICIAYTSVMISNVTNLSLQNFNFENCNKNHNAYLETNFEYDYASINNPGRNASIFLHNCTSVVISNINVLATAGTTGIFIVNVKSNSSLTNISITVDYTVYSTSDEHQKQISGILLYYDHQNNRTTKMELDSFQFNTIGSCVHLLQYAITVLLFQNNTNVSFIISNMNFNSLKSVSALYYYGETCGISASNTITFNNCVISNNIGYNSNTAEYFKFKIFEIVLYNRGCFDAAFLKHFCSQQYNNISFINCKFVDNHNISSMIHITPASSRAVTGYINVINCLFHSNRDTHFFILKSNTDNVWQLSNYIYIRSTDISSNSHSEGQDLLSATNCYIKIENTLMTSNIFYENIMKLHLSGSIFQDNITIVNNTARQMFYGSYILICENTTINISYNTAYMVVRQAITMGINTRPVCGVQFYSTQGNLDSLNATEWPFKVVAVNNTHMTSKNSPEDSKLYTNCQWLAGTAFHTRNSTEVYRQTYDIENIIIENSVNRSIPLSVCKCENSSSGNNSVDHAYDCYSPYLGSIFPGETLTVQLIVQGEWHRDDNSVTIVNENSSGQDDCHIVHTSELSQTHFSNINSCNIYHYTLWPKNEKIKECQLFIGVRGMPEMFYVDVKSCPKGFTFQEQKKACYCDPLLNSKLLSTAPCSAKDETISRPANSWIYAHTDENSNTHDYQVSLYCPFNHCLSESSYLNLSNPDSQCQFNRTGVLCGKCKQGLSVVLGTPQCKPCSNIYLLLLIPVALTGIALVTALYIFNLTVQIGTIHTLIFYVNVVNINILTLFPGCHSIVCIIFSHLNFNFRTKTCFYNGLDDYTKEWLHLVHTCYFISIPILFILLSRHSPTVQRLTAQRALPVLATLILLAYTKILLTVCNVLFRYSPITHLPSNKTELVWSISTTTPLFGPKFWTLFIVCLLLFLILIPFNLTLLFTRKLSNFKLVTKLKPLLDTYFSAYKDKAYYWTGFLLLIRLIVYVLSAFDNDICFMTTSMLFVCLLCLHGVVRPFKNTFHNIHESVIIANLLAAHVAPLYKKDSLGLKVAQILLTIGIIYVIIVVVFHCCMYRWGDTIYKCIKSLRHRIYEKKTPQDKFFFRMEGWKSRIADVTYNYKEFQEPLVEYDS